MREIGNLHLLKDVLSSQENLNTLRIYITLTLLSSRFVSVNIIEVNEGNGDFQSTALPTELPSQQQKLLDDAND